MHAEHAETCRCHKIKNEKKNEKKKNEKRAEKQHIANILEMHITYAFHPIPYSLDRALMSCMAGR